MYLYLCHVCGVGLAARDSDRAQRVGEGLAVTGSGQISTEGSHLEEQEDGCHQQGLQ